MSLKQIINLIFEDTKSEQNREKEKGTKSLFLLMKRKIFQLNWENVKLLK